MKKVLVIEDNEDNRKIVRYALERAGYKVISAERGEDGLKLPSGNCLISSLWISTFPASTA
jgi:CheY-like chemotaxis protein